MGELVRIGSTREVPPGAVIAVDVKDRRIALFNVGGRYYALDEVCTHRGGPLSEGTVEGNTVICPWHAAKFDITTGKVMTPFGRDTGCYNITIDGDDIQIEV